MTTRIPRCHRRAYPRVEQLEPRDCPATLFDPDLAVRDAIAGLEQPTGVAFFGPNDLFIIEKASGKVKRFTDGAANGVPLDLAVNSASERGLLGIALHPDFARNGFVYLYWTESTTGADSGNISQVPLLGNRVDRFHWNGSTLTFDRNIIMLRARQDDATNGREAGNHDGGKVRFGPDGNLYIMIGDNGRRGQLQNLPDGWAGSGLPDDQFGGPEPDDAHLTGVVLRLNDDGSTPRDNPFFRAGEEWGGTAGANIQKVFAYGLRNGFGMAFDPVRGDLWDAQNGDDSFSEINRIEAGDNLGWVQVMGPIDRVAQFKAIETDTTTVDPVTGRTYFNLQQIRWSPVNIADTPDEALARMFQVVEKARLFTADMIGDEEVPGVATTASARIFAFPTSHGTLRYLIQATDNITGAVQAHFHFAGDGQNGTVVAFLLPFVAAGRNFRAGEIIAQGALTDADLIERPGFPNPTIDELVARMKQGRVYANLHTRAHPGGEIRGQMIPHGRQVSHYSDPEFSWKFEMSPVGLGFLDGDALGSKYEGDLFVGEARTFLQNGYLFRLDLSPNRKAIAPSDPGLVDGVADNTHKFDLTGSESLQFGEGFGITTEVLTGPNGHLFVLSLTDGVLREISRRPPVSGAAIFGGSLLSGPAAPPTPAPPVPATPPRSAAVVVPSDDARRPDEPGAVEVRTVTVESGPRVTPDDPLALDLVVVG
ncbi:MAG TPA: PQQ-dependent sugar dehydrogenase [Fimbriiglobus sp.]|nr:PQQ-dependent sugar dehydrogenase [Fimbriiglobus sp.]